MATSTTIPLIVRVANPNDVALAIDFARDNGLEIAVRSGGHSAAGHSTVEGGLVIDLRDMKQLEIDPEARTAWAQTGLNALEVTTAAWEHKLVIGFGDTGSVGIGGITLGGVGYMGRLHGLTIDNLLAAEIVTADGSTLVVDESSHPDLFWAIRGGGGNFGVVTRFKYQLHAVDTYVGGMLVLPATAETVSGFIKAAADAPDEVSTIANVMNAPPMPFLPEEVVGKLIIFAFIGHSGEEKAGIEAMKPFQSSREPYADFLKPMPYTEMYQPEDESYRPLAVDHIFYMNSVDAEMAQTIIDRLDASDAPLRAAQLRVLGGAIARVPADATAYAHRDKKIMAIAVTFFEGEDDLPRRLAWLDETVAAMDQRPGRVCEFRSSRRRSVRPLRIPGRHVRATGTDQGPVRPREHLPPQRERTARARVTDASYWHRTNKHVIEEFRANNGEVKSRKWPVILLTTTGAKTGRKHVTPLNFSRDGDDIVVIASKGGSATHPDWYLNLVAHPEVEIEDGPEKYRARATVARGRGERVSTMPRQK